MSHWRLLEGKVDLTDAKWSKQARKAVEKALSVLQMHVPELCELVSAEYPARYKYNFDGGIRGNLTLRPNRCSERHEYHVAPAVWFVPQCRGCEAEFEHQCSVDSRWRKRALKE